MERQLENIMATVASDTMEKLGFLFASPDLERIDDGPEPADVGRVKFTGPFGGTLGMRISSAVASELAINMLGLDDDAEVAPADQQDALRELLNVICGNLLPILAKDEAEFNIGPPETRSCTDVGQPVLSGNPVCVVRLMLDEGFCDLYLSFEGDPPRLNLRDDSAPVSL